MGSNRDCNLNIIPNVICEVYYTNCIRVTILLKMNINKVASQLSITFYSEYLKERVGNNARKPYRVFLTPIINKLI